MKHSTKVIKLNPQRDKSELPAPPAKGDLQGMAKYQEAEGNLTEAAKLYEKLIKANPTAEFSYNRLMMIYRKLKNYKNELRLINEGIRVFQELYTPSKVGKHKNIIKISKQLNMLTGLTDNKGKSLYDAEPIGKWKKRKEVVLKKLGKA